MKKLIWIFVIFFSFTSFNSLKAYDTTFVKYLPLQIGNTWIYYGYGHVIHDQFSWYSKYTVTGTVDISGHRYWVIQETKIQISGTNNISLPQFQQLRYDSISTNLYSPDSGCSSLETIRDSLSSKLNNWAYKCYPDIHEVCMDTSSLNIFNQTLPSKSFSNAHSSATTYVKNIGIAFWDFGEVSIGYNMNLRGCVINGIAYGDTSIVGIIICTFGDPVNFSLSQNYPNPFNPVTKINFAVPNVVNGRDRSLRLIIYDALGRKVETLVDKQVGPGYYSAEWNAAKYPSGVYFYRLEAGDYIQTKKMVLVK